MINTRLQGLIGVAAVHPRLLRRLIDDNTPAHDRRWKLIERLRKEYDFKYRCLEGYGCEQIEDRTANPHMKEWTYSLREELEVLHRRIRYLGENTSFF